ncbi:ABC transporter permease [Sporolactobacillus sp. CPB3-1]|uniref:Putative hemin transport system permease protein HrtB n=1 Tax=Sporolactobacillus mangiferae TaxID=2940498 RepID=A0ABT0MEN1_9BACL|nr:ABC transporter permease [Sporolactobacillus mangiferae]MCL1632785.1 ABC transporter permease [Sporolactobacillus mangiferae]
MYLAWKEIRHSKGRFFFMMVIISLLAYLVFFVSGLASGLAKDNASSIENLGKHTFILQKDADQRINRSALSSETVSKLSSTFGKDKVTVLNLQSTTVNRVGKQQKIDLTLFNLDGSQSFRPSLTAGNEPSPQTTTDIIIDQSIKRNGIHLYDTIKEQSSGLTFKVTGFTKNATFSHMPVAYLNQRQWHLFTEKRKVSGQKAVHAAVTTPFSLKKTRQLADRIHLNQNISEVSADTVIRALPGYKEEQSSLQMMISFLFIISVFILGIFFYMITAQKQAQFGILKAIGTSTGYLVRSLIFQTLITLFVSLGFSLLLTVLTVFVLPPGMPFSLSPNVIIERLLAFTGISLLSILLSIWQIIKISALSAIEGR